MEKDFKKYATKHIGLNSTLVDDVISSQVSASMTPMILEERKMRASLMSVFDRMMMDRIIWISGPITNRTSSVVQAQLMYLNSVNDDRDITIHLDTPGGSVMAGLSIIDVMNYVKPDIATINLGMCASMGSVLLSSGTKGKRSSLIYSKVMTHMVSHGTSGNIQDTRISQLEAEKYNYILFKKLAENTGKSFEDVYVLSRFDRWFNSDEALEFGLIDEIIGLDNNNTISSMLDGFDEYYKDEVLNNNILLSNKNGNI
jgi:ATP-dependent Clp protease protease subunit